MVEPFTFSGVHPKSCSQSLNNSCRKLIAHPSQLRHADIVKLPSGITLTPIPGQESCTTAEFEFKSYYVSI